MSRFLLDENVPLSLVDALRAAGHEAEAAASVGLKSAHDDIVFAYAQRMQATVVSQDLDFSDLRNFPVGNHYGIVVLRLKDYAPDEMAARLVDALATEVKRALFGSLVVVDRRQSRQVSA